MEFIIAIVVIGLVLQAIYWVVVNIIFPIGTFLVIAAPVIGAIIGFMASTCFFVVLVQKINPYKTYVDTHPDAPAGGRRNYFFGPGIHQILEVIKESNSRLLKFVKIADEFKDENWAHVYDFWDAVLTFRGIKNLLIILGYLAAVISVMFFGEIWLAIFSAVLATIIFVGMAIFHAFFWGLWGIDRGLLWIQSIHSRCPKCKRRSVIPVFVCPNCGMEHKHLVPGPYGVFKRKCSCGAKLATTFIGGRSKYEAHCPFCDATLLSSNSQQYGIQLVGGTETGKTTFLTAFWHEYRAWLDEKQNVNYKGTPEDVFLQLENWFANGEAEATTETNASMYSIIHERHNKPSVQMTIYDIAGEVFGGTASEMQQQQFRYCEGFLIVIDPTGTSDFASENITNFINTMNEVKGKHTSKLIDTPVAVIITKSDMYKREIGLPKIKSLLKTSGLDSDSNRNNVCRTFLFEHDFSNAVNLLEAEFSNIGYFPVSAMGHDMKVGQYEPWGVLDPVFWLMNSKNCPLRDIL